MRYSADGIQELCGVDSDDLGGGGCSLGYFQCDNSNCIPSSWRCDGDIDCGDLSDEIGCGCPVGQWKCRNNNCININWRCDGDNDCGDLSDEASCPGTCPHGLWQCANGNCINRSWVCDSDNDCGDGSDEVVCFKVKRSEIPEKSKTPLKSDKSSDQGDEQN